jgi:hypothetical protein
MGEKRYVSLCDVYVGVYWITEFENQCSTRSAASLKEFPTAGSLEHYQEAHTVRGPRILWEHSSLD